MNLFVQHPSATAVLKELYNNDIGSIIHYSGERPLMGSAMGACQNQNYSAQQQMNSLQAHAQAQAQAQAQAGAATAHQDWQQQAFRSQQKIRERSPCTGGSPLPPKQRQEKIDKLLSAVKGELVKPGDMPKESEVTLSEFLKKEGLNENGSKKEKTMFGTFKSDVKNFMIEHKGLIYGILGLYLLDHFVLEGKLKAKLLELAHKLIGKLETKVDQIGTSAIEQK